MRYLIYGPNNKKLGQLQNTSSIQWKPRYNDRGQAEIHAYATDENREYLIPDNRIVCVERKEVVFIKYVNEESNEIEIKGYLDNLDDRINLTTATIKNVETSLYNLVNSNKRNLNIETASVTGLSLVLDSEIETTYDELINTITDVCQKAGCGFRINFKESDGSNVLKLYKGTYKNGVRFSDRLGNMINQKYSQNMQKYKNKAYVLGDGEGSNRTMVVVDRSAGEAVQEMYVDARDLQSENYASQSSYIEALTDRGNNKIDEIQDGCKSLSFDLVQNSVSGIFGKDYDIGDIVPAISTKYNIKTYVRIVGANFIEEEGKDVKTTLQVEIEGQELNNDTNSLSIG